MNENTPKNTPKNTPEFTTNMYEGNPLSDLKETIDSIENTPIEKPQVTQPIIKLTKKGLVDRRTISSRKNAMKARLVRTTNIQNNKDQIQKFIQDIDTDTDTDSNSDTDIDSENELISYVKKGFQSGKGSKLDKSFQKTMIKLLKKRSVTNKRDKRDKKDKRGSNSDATRPINIINVRERDNDPPQKHAYENDPYIQELLKQLK